MHCKPTVMSGIPTTGVDMPRLELSEDGDSFLDLRIVQNEEGFGAEIGLRLPAVRGRSVVVLHDVISWGEDVHAAREFFDGIVLRRSWECALSEKAGFFSIRWPYGSENALFSAAWHDEYGDIDYHTYVPADGAGRFQEAVRAAWEPLLQGDRREKGKI